MVAGILFIFSLLWWLFWLWLHSVIQPTGDGNLAYIGLGFLVWLVGLLLIGAVAASGEAPPPTGRYDHGTKRLD